MVWRRSNWELEDAARHHEKIAREVARQRQIEQEERSRGRASSPASCGGSSLIERIGNALAYVFLAFWLIAGLLGVGKGLLTKKWDTPEFTRSVSVTIFAVVCILTIMEGMTWRAWKWVIACVVSAIIISSAMRGTLWGNWQNIVSGAIVVAAAVGGTLGYLLIGIGSCALAVHLIGVLAHKLPWGDDDPFADLLFGAIESACLFVGLLHLRGRFQWWLVAVSPACWGLLFLCKTLRREAHLHVTWLDTLRRPPQMMHRWSNGWWCRLRQRWWYAPAERTWYRLTERWWAYRIRSTRSAVRLVSIRPLEYLARAGSATALESLLESFSGEEVDRVKGRIYFSLLGSGNEVAIQTAFDYRLRWPLDDWTHVCLLSSGSACVAPLVRLLNNHRSWAREICGMLGTIGSRQSIDALMSISRDLEDQKSNAMLGLQWAGEQLVGKDDALAVEVIVYMAEEGYIGHAEEVLKRINAGFSPSIELKDLLRKVPTETIKRATRVGGFMMSALREASESELTRRRRAWKKGLS